MILSVSKISKSYGTDVILSDISFHLEDKEKAALIGDNGAGKSTLLKIIAGKEKADSGDVTIPKDMTVGYLSQYQEELLSGTIRDALYSSRPEIVATEKRLRELEHEIAIKQGDELERCLKEYDRLNHEFERNDGYAYSSEVTGVLKGLGFTIEDFDRPVEELSGGQKTRVALGRLLIQKPDLLLLDEPINHLDMESVQWLEGFLAAFPKAVLIVAHDRYFLDRTVKKVIEIRRHEATCYIGNYTEFRQKKEIVEIAERKAYEKQQKEIAHQEAVIEKLQSFNREKSIKRAESRKKVLDKIERIDAPIMDSESMKLHFPAGRRSGEDVMFVDDLSKAFDDNVLFRNINFELKRGQKMAILGDNGTGKTTMLKIINDLLPADTGKVTLGTNVDIGYYDQEHQSLNAEGTVFDEISDEYPDMNNTEIRNLLGAFLFRGDDVFKLVGDLSGGERARVSLAKLMLSGANFLILDEPTNHLDMKAKEVLEEALIGYDGTVLFVSHDRYFVNRVADHIIELQGDSITTYLGNYDDFLADKARRTAFVSQIPAPCANDKKEAEVVTPNTGTSKLDWQAAKEQKAKRNKLKNDLAKTEEAIEKAETKKSELEAEVLKDEVARNSVKLQEVTKAIADLDEKLLELMDKWELLSGELEEAERLSD